jgi:hypothetical protein
VSRRHRGSDAAEHRDVPEREHGTLPNVPIGTLAGWTTAVPCVCVHVHGEFTEELLQQ